MPRTVARLLIATVALWLSTTATVSARGPLPPLADWHLDFGDLATSGLSDRGTGGLPDDPSDPAAMGTWAVSDIHYADGILGLHVDIEPPAWSLPVEAVPAVLFTTLDLGGGVGGDVGYQRVVSVQHVALPACDPAACRFGTDVALDVSRMPRIGRRVPGFENPRVWLAFTLVRSFAGGTWLQYLDVRIRAGPRGDT